MQGRSLQEKKIPGIVYDILSCCLKIQWRVYLKRSSYKCKRRYIRSGVETYRVMRWKRISSKVIYYGISNRRIFSDVYSEWSWRKSASCPRRNSWNWKFSAVRLRLSKNIFCCWVKINIFLILNRKYTVISIFFYCCLFLQRPMIVEQKT